MSWNENEPVGWQRGMWGKLKDIEVRQQAIWLALQVMADLQGYDIDFDGILVEAAKRHGAGTARRGRKRRRRRKSKSQDGV